MKATTRASIAHLVMGNCIRIPCPGCDSMRCPDTCIYSKLAKVQQSMLYIPCPECQKPDADRNAKGLLECRSCHAQFERTGNRVTKVHTEKGTGDFPKEKTLARIYEELLALARKRQEEAAE
jgi:ribosomal protein L37AE/L43A